MVIIEPAMAPGKELAPSAPPVKFTPQLSVNPSVGGFRGLSVYLRVSAGSTAPDTAADGIEGEALPYAPPGRLV